ncbi:hypothetical protein CMU71_06655 [Elizabethkingia anophelis]|uniref:hypothetical protein n=1 Tax=Elizabethkingia anophelis TaxID=1117645 RepID=UPI0005315C45|nr:hypothetical protein [Elizabethkingia anophelis]KGT08133.1 hypothetical protein NV63_18245 [Elizabethkingia anophelis]MCT4287265.1 hypothetical protein [Elizabethkingia anophelis]MDV3566578.1 hypothetical protein [Elizabethkingia anophelis]MDV3877928.1 hypothetical protein [Elizabethkingia anophelis]MDV3970639.1 hypothetical protein [Elizabethkingia anophelis]
MKKTLKIIVPVIIFLGVFLVAGNFIKVTPNETLLYKIQQYVTYSKADWENYERNKQLLAENQVPASQITDVAQAVQQDDIYPVDTNFATPAVKAQEMERIKKAKFENLVVAKIKPDDEDAQAALIRFTRDRLTDVIINQKLNIKVGKCYVNANTEGNFNCVSCMILLYNCDKKDWQEAPDGENFLKNSYDFYQSSEGTRWEAKDLSMQIPFDYTLRKKYSVR